MRYSLFIGRWQPLHEGHVALIRKVLNEGKPVLVAMRETGVDEANPYTITDRIAMFEKKFWKILTTDVHESLVCAIAELVD